MASEPNELGPVDPDNLPYPDYRKVLSALPNAEQLNALDLALLELEKRLLKYARVGPEVLGMADTNALHPHGQPQEVRGPPAHRRQSATSISRRNLPRPRAARSDTRRSGRR